MKKLKKLEEEILSEIQMLKEDLNEYDGSMEYFPKFKGLIDYRINILTDVLEKIDLLMEEN